MNEKYNFSPHGTKVELGSLWFFIFFSSLHCWFVVPFILCFFEPQFNGLYCHFKSTVLYFSLELCPKQRIRTLFSVPTAGSRNTQEISVGNSMENLKLWVNIEVSRVDSRELKHSSPNLRSMKTCYKRGWILVVVNILTRDWEIEESPKNAWES